MSQTVDLAASAAQRVELRTEIVKITKAEMIELEKYKLARETERERNHLRAEKKRIEDKKKGLKTVQAVVPEAIIEPLKETLKLLSALPAEKIEEFSSVIESFAQGARGVMLTGDAAEPVRPLTVMEATQVEDKVEQAVTKAIRPSRVDKVHAGKRGDVVERTV